MSKKFYFSKRQVGYLLVLPAFAIISGVLFFPLAYSVYLALHNLHITNPRLGVEYVGFYNFLYAFHDSLFWASIINTAYITLIDNIAGITVGLGIALLLNRRFKLRGVVRGLVLFPYILAPIVLSLMWKWIYNADYGLLNGILYRLGLISEYRSWLSDPWTAMHLIIVGNFWQGLPFGVLFYLAALQTIPKNLYESARIDGATQWKEFLYITLPLLMPITLVILVLKTIWTFKLFDIIYIITKGGPADATRVVAYHLYLEGFAFLNLGKAAAASHILLGIVFVITFVYYKFLRKSA